ncbi:MAG: phage major tail protein, TP901-1 family [Pseudomonadota bacterium]
MSGQRGRDLLLKIDDGTGTFVTVAGIRSKTLSFSAAAVDGTHTESPDAWREIIEGAGVKSAKISGRGVFKDASSDALIRQTFFSGLLATWQITVPDFGHVRGQFAITELSYSGDHNGEATFSITLESAGELDFEVIQ